MSARVSLGECLARRSPSALAEQAENLSCAASRGDADCVTQHCVAEFALCQYTRTSAIALRLQWPYRSGDGQLNTRRAGRAD
jgi:hypothetical protein